MPDSVTWEDAEQLTDKELISLAIESNPGMTYARIESGLTCLLKVTRCVSLWRNEECYLAGDKPRGTLEGYPPYNPRFQASTPAPAHCPEHSDTCPGCALCRTAL